MSELLKKWKRNLEKVAIAPHLRSPLTKIEALGGMLVGEELEEETA